MKLKKLEIELQPSYRPNGGKYTAEIEYEGESGKIQMHLDEKISEAILLVIGPVITKFGHQAALRLEESLIQSVEEARKMPAIEAQSMEAA